MKCRLTWNFPEIPLPNQLRMQLRPRAHSLVSSLPTVAKQIALLKCRGAYERPIPHEDRELLSWSLSRVVYHVQADVVLYLLEQEGTPLDSLSPINVAVSPSIQLFQILIDHGRVTNQSGLDQGAGSGQCLFQLVCDDEFMVCWCLDHGALMEDRHTDPYRCPPLLEIVAGVGTVPIFILLHSRAARLGCAPCIALLRAQRQAAVTLNVCPFGWP